MRAGLKRQNLKCPHSALAQAATRIKEGLRSDTNKHQRDGGNSSALTHDIVQCTFAVSWPGGHLLLHCFHGKNLNPHVYRVAHIEGHMFHEEVIGNETVLSELNFDSHSLDRLSAYSPICKYPAFISNRNSGQRSRMCAEARSSGLG